MKKFFFASLLIFFATLSLGTPLAVDAQGGGPEGGGGQVTGTGTLPPPESIPGAPRMSEQQIRIIATILSNYDGRPPFTDGVSGQAGIRALIVAEPLASRLSSGQIDQMVTALSRYAQAEDADPAYVPAPVQTTPVVPVRSGAEADRVPSPTFSNDPYLPAEIISLFALLALLGYVLN